MRRVLSNRGSISVVGMITSLVVAIVSLAVLEYVLGYKQYAEHTVYQGDFNSLNAQIASIIQNEDSCRRTLGGALVYGGALQAPQVIPTTAIGDSHNVVLYYPQNVAGVPPLFAGKVAGIGSTWGRLRSVTMQLQIDDNNPAVLGANTYFGHFELRAHIPKGIGTAKLIGSNDIFITFHLNGLNQIDTCTGMTFVGNTGAIQPLPNCGPGQRIYSDGITITCKQAVCVWPLVRQPAWLADGSANCL